MHTSTNPNPNPNSGLSHDPDRSSHSNSLSWTEPQPGAGGSVPQHPGMEADIMWRLVDQQCCNWKRSSIESFAGAERHRGRRRERAPSPPGCLSRARIVLWTSREGQFKTMPNCRLLCPNNCWLIHLREGQLRLSKAPLARAPSPSSTCRCIFSTWVKTISRDDDR